MFSIEAIFFQIEYFWSKIIKKYYAHGCRQAFFLNITVKEVRKVGKIDSSHQNSFDEVLKLWAPAFWLQPRRRVSGDEEEGAHGVHVAERRLRLRHLEGRDAETPQVGAIVVRRVGVLVAGNDL